jgi:prepilin-type N-terminal cleavage/methylation domain-containing protein
MRPSKTFHLASDGFTLVEMAIVLLIVGLLLGGLIPMISGQVEQRRITETNKQLDEIKEALIGFAIINGRLPCPASSTSSGVESPTTGTGICDHNYDGYVPAVTLGIPGTNGSGFVVDSWGNPIRYAVTAWSGNTFTIPNGMSTKGISNLTPTDLLVCSTATGIGSSSCAAGTSLTSSGVPVVIFSTGKDGGNGFANPDEAANLHSGATANYKTFVSHDFSPTFGDLVIWISPNVLVNHMVAAGKLP